MEVKEEKAGLRVPFIAGNWKMNKTIAEAKKLAAEITKSAFNLEGAEIVLCPPFTALYEVAKTIEGSSIQLGAQDIFWENGGAFTGEISGSLLRDVGCQYVIVGHSERRQIIGENDWIINRKVKAALRNQLLPILCLGETLEERQKGLTLTRIKAQLDEALKDVNQDDVSKIIIAYEPVWAIGTGVNATPAQAQEAHHYIRMLLAEKYGQELAACAIILYGGSVKPENASSLAKEADVDGFLVGGASLDHVSFVKIIEKMIEVKGK
ncbi:MAG: triose-phosphate isomerase [Candidatus Aminicenantes bacterium]|nr:triose-phosphate isomerase [Candidatus Aminicenantes bacterium]